ncbi:MAG: discoidin domain-containing protein [Bacteroidales bacterium]|nr:discoidin domain-containing protein [Bacteroidales bacterium]
MTKFHRYIILAIASIAVLATRANAQDESIFPQFPSPADTLDAIFYDDKVLTGGEVVMLATLQGQVNSKQPRIYIMKRRHGGRSEWADRIDINTRITKPSQLYHLVGKYGKEVEGMVVYSTEKSLHYRNLACTIAGLKNAIAVTSAEKQKLKENGIRLKTLCDITDLPYTTPQDIYTYLYKKYWKDCSRKTFLHLTPHIAADIRDLGTAMKAAFLWLDPRKEVEREVLKKFLADMTPGKSVILGWWHEERAGIGIATSYGLSTIPSDLYNNATVYAGFPREISPARIPKRKPLENKVYVALFLSDGDNIQYCQHTMCRLWDNPKRGTFPINWTVSPGLADLGPGLLNYYYNTASDLDCLVSGPSGMGYSLIYDELNDIWHTSERETIEEYTKLTDRYLKKSGIRIITIWDRVNQKQKEAYADNCRHLIGVTLEDWKRAPKIQASSSNDRLAFIGNRPCYTSYVEDMFREWEDSIRVFDGKAPAFFTSQGESWHMGPGQMAKLQSLFDSIEPGRAEICRADHFFSLYNEANGLSFNILMLDNVKITSDDESAPVESIADGSFAKKYTWTAAQKGERKVVFDLGKEYMIDRYLISHASAGGCDREFNIQEYTFEVSQDGQQWEKVETRTVGQSDFSDSDIQPVKARYACLTINRCGKDDLARIADIEIFGKIIK